MTSLSGDDLSRLADKIKGLHDIVPKPGSTARAAEVAINERWSSYGIFDEQPEVSQMVRQALEVGYLTALSDRRDGKLD
jgi:hypothetical protein